MDIDLYIYFSIFFSFFMHAKTYVCVSLQRYMCVCLCACTPLKCISAPEASCRRVFDPCAPLLFDLCYFLEQNGHFVLVPEHAPGPISQVLPGCRVRHPLGYKNGFVRIYIYIASVSLCFHSCKDLCVFAFVRVRISNKCRHVL